MSKSSYSPPFYEKPPTPPHIELLLFLEGNGPQPRTMHVLTHALRKTPEQILDSVEQLKQRGCVFEENPEHGFKLISIGIECWVDILEDQVGWPYQRIEVYRRTESTQNVCKRYAQELGEKAIGTVVIADEQTHGRGRLGRTWNAPPGTALLFSFVGHPSISPDRFSHIIAHDLFEGLSWWIGGKARLSLKWPNDILLEGKKVAGILIERINGLPVVGIGINTHTKQDQFPSDIACTATSFACRMDPPDRNFILFSVLSSLKSNCLFSNEDSGTAKWERIQGVWRKHCDMLGWPFRFESNGKQYEGECLDIDIATGLIVRRDTGEIITLPAATTSVVK
ncbi:MAG: biotin--[acetyl-CoA-carboxylase] ligase [Planctomycetota bacterium]